MDLSEAFFRDEIDTGDEEGNCFLDRQPSIRIRESRAIYKGPRGEVPLTI